MAQRHEGVEGEEVGFSRTSTKKGARVIPRSDVLVGNLTHVGMERSENQDYYGYYEPESDEDFDLHGRLIIVCDGMGGHAGGERASRLAVEAMKETYSADKSGNLAEALRNAIAKANRAVWDEAVQKPELKGMGSTAVAIVVKHGTAWVGHVGDSRCYLVRDGQLHHLTKDHSLVQQMVEEGLLRAEDMESHPDKNVILRSMGVKPEVEVDVAEMQYQVGDIFVLSSDGLTGLVSDEECRQIVLAHKDRPMEACQKLVDLANQYGGYDNITVQICRVMSLRPGEPVEAAQETGVYTQEEVKRSIEEARQQAVKLNPSQEEMAKNEAPTGSGDSITTSISADEIEKIKKEAIEQAKKEQEEAELAKAKPVSAAGAGRSGGLGLALTLAGVGVLVGCLVGVVLSKSSGEAYARLQAARATAEAGGVAADRDATTGVAFKNADEAVESYQGLFGPLTAGGDLESAAEELEALAPSKAASAQHTAEGYAKAIEAMKSSQGVARTADASRYASEKWQAATTLAQRADEAATAGTYGLAITSAYEADACFAQAALEAVTEQARAAFIDSRSDYDVLQKAAQAVGASEHAPELMKMASDRRSEAESMQAANPAGAVALMQAGLGLLRDAKAVAPVLKKKN